MKKYLPALVLVSIFGCIQPAPDPSVPVPLAGQVVFVTELIAAHNAFRQSKGKGILTQDPKLQAAAEAHARDMAKNTFMSHTGSDWSSPFKRITRAGYTWSAAGENVAWNQQTVAAVMTSWEWSPGHRINILSGGYRNIGAACVYSASGQPYWCVDFGTPAVGAVAQGDSEPETVTEKRPDTSSVRMSVLDQ